MTDRYREYVARLEPAPPALLLELEQLGAGDGIPIVDRATGRLLSTLVHCMQANRILEIGTAYGYSTLWMALAMPPAGHLWTIDPDRDRTEVAQRFLERAGIGDKVEVINQPATDILENFGTRNLDIVFLDANEEDYPRYLDLCVPLLKRSGLLVVDDLLLHGKAALEPKAADAPSVRAVRTFNRLFLEHPQLDATILPVGGGVGVGARVQ